MALSKTVEELDATLTRTGWLNWMAFYRLNPFGQKVEDARFMALRAEIRYMNDCIRFAVHRAAGGKGGTQPTYKEGAEFPIFKRHGTPKPKTKRDFRDMTQQEISDSMNQFAKMMNARNASTRPR